VIGSILAWRAMSMSLGTDTVLPSFETAARVVAVMGVGRGQAFLILR
jgi:hypothetical protein